MSESDTIIIRRQAFWVYTLNIDKFSVLSL